MMSIFFILVAVFRPSVSCLNGPFIHDNYTKSMTVTEGQLVRLKCYAGGQTNAPIKWHKEPFLNSTNQNTTLPNGDQSYSGNVLEFTSITRHQRGLYICSVNDQYGSASRYIRVTVNFVPIIIETHRIHRFESKELELRCNAQSDPPANVRWFKDDREVQMNEYYRINTEREFDDTLNSTFIESSYHNGLRYTYKCKIANLLGTAIAFFVVTNEK